MTEGARDLRSVVAERLDQHWVAWAQEHPRLAAAIDRAVLVETTVARLRDSKEFKEAMARAALDEKTLSRAANVLAVAEREIARSLLL